MREGVCREVKKGGRERKRGDEPGQEGGGGWGVKGLINAMASA